MNWEDIIGQHNIKKTLRESIENQRVGHAQMFVGHEGYGGLPLALAYAKEILVRENPDSAPRADHLTHLDIHFSFPTYSENGSAVSKNFLTPFINMIGENPYADYSDWTHRLESSNKQLLISVHEINQQNADFSLKSFDGGSKILIMWCADKINDQAANKFLKFLEEPPKNTIIILCVRNAEDMLPTITSRCQIIEIPRIDDQSLEDYLRHKNVEEERIPNLLRGAQGNFNTLQKLLTAGENEDEFETLFIQWVREAFQVKKNPQLLVNIISWARNISYWNRDKQQDFLAYCSEIFRLALLQNYGSTDLVYKTLGQKKFNWNAFAHFISGANIEDILSEISEANYQIERNGNGKIIWTDLGIKLSRYIHKG